MDKNYYLEIGQTIKDLRLKHKMTKTELAKGICSISYITRIENGERCPTSVILHQISTKLGISSEYLFRAIDSPSSHKINKLIDTIFYYYERHDPASIHQLIIDNENAFLEASAQEKKVLNSFMCLCNGVLYPNQQYSLSELISNLHPADSDSVPHNDMEFFHLFCYGILLTENSQNSDAYTFLSTLKEYTESLEFIRCKALVPDFYSTLSYVCLQTNRLEECLFYNEKATIYCKEYNVHALLPILYHQKGEALALLGRKEEAKLWYSNATILLELIFTPEQITIYMLKSTKFTANF